MVNKELLQNLQIQYYHRCVDLTRTGGPGGLEVPYRACLRRKPGDFHLARSRGEYRAVLSDTSTYSKTGQRTQQTKM